MLLQGQDNTTWWWFLHFLLLPSLPSIPLFLLPSLLLPSLSLSFLSDLKVNDNPKHEDGGHEIGQVGKVTAVEGLTQTTDLVCPCCQKMKECNYSTFKLCPSARVDGGGAERLPDNRLTDVGGDEERDTRTKTVTFLKEFIE